MLADSEALQRSLMERMKAAEERLARISRQTLLTGNDGELDGELEAARPRWTSWNVSVRSGTAFGPTSSRCCVGSTSF